MLKAKIFTLAALVVVLMCMSKLSTFAQFDSPLELLWEVQNIGKYGEVFAVSPDETIFVASHQSDSTALIRVYNMQDGILLREFPSPFCSKQMVFMSNSHYLALTGRSCSTSSSINSSGKIIIMDVENGHIKDSWEFPDTLQNRGGNYISVSPNYRYISATVTDSRMGYENANYVIYDTKDKSIYARIFSQLGSNSAFSLDSKYFFFTEITGKQNFTFWLKMFDMETKEVKTIHTANNPITDITFSRDSTKMLFARDRDILGIYHLNDSKLDTIKLDEQYSSILSANFIDDDHILLSPGSGTYGIGILDINNNKMTMLSKERAGITTLFKDKNTIFYAAYVWAGKVSGLDNIFTDVKTGETSDILFPNPTTNVLTVHSSSLITPHQIHIYDLSGQKVNLSLDKITIQNYELIINVSGLVKGTYILTVQSQINIKSYKFLVTE